MGAISGAADGGQSHQFRIRLNPDLVGGSGQDRLDFGHLTY
jgi:hypothetical protein